MTAISRYLNLCSAFSAAECVSDHGKAMCTELGGACVTERDGYYIVSCICITLGASILLFYIWPAAKKLQGGFVVL